MVSVWKVKVIGPIFKVIGMSQNRHFYTTFGARHVSVFSVLVYVSQYYGGNLVLQTNIGNRRVYKSNSQ